MCGLYRPVRLGSCHCAVVVLGFAPKDVTDELDQEGVTAGSRGCFLDEMRRYVETGRGENRGEGHFDVADARGVEVYFVRPAQERRNAL